MITEKPTEQLPELLNRIEAALESGALTSRELGAAVMPGKSGAHVTARVHEWVKARSRGPNGETALRMSQLASEVEARLEIAGGKGESLKAYSKALKAIQKKRKGGSNGKG